MIETLLINLFKGSLLFSWAISLGITAILLAPSILVLLLPKQSRFRFRYTAAGAAFGAIAVPLSFWLYIHFFVDPLRMFIFGLPGVFMFPVHLGVFRNPGLASHDIVVDPLNGFTAGLSSTSFQEVLFWMVSYALVGALVDWYKSRKSACV